MFSHVSFILVCIEIKYAEGMRQCTSSDIFLKKNYEDFGEMSLAKKEEIIEQDQRLVNCHQCQVTNPLRSTGTLIWS